jgi:hypothetical protein
MDSEEDVEEKSSINFAKIKTFNSNLLLLILSKKSKYISISCNPNLRVIFSKFVITISPMEVFKWK